VKHLMKCEAVEEIVSCDNCGEKTRAWDWSGFHDRFCLECLARQSAEWDYDPRAGRADFEYDRNR
jgi:RecJ-like exonuclease